jgi:SAM-dependent methyltransferase
MGQIWDDGPSSTGADLSYADPRVARVYAALHGPGPDIDHHRRLAGPVGRDVLDLGCGTGRLGLALAGDGHRVVGVDPSAAMIAEARRQDRDGTATWVVGDARTLDQVRSFDLVSMTGHAYQALLDDDGQQRALRAIHAHLRPGGRFAFETRNPGAEAWRGWTPELTRREVAVEELGAVVVGHEVDAVVGDLVTYQTSYRFAEGSELVTTTTLRFPSQEVITGALVAAGFETVTVHGTWDGAPVTPTAPELVVVARVPSAEDCGREHIEAGAPDVEGPPVEVPEVEGGALPA